MQPCVAASQDTSSTRRNGEWSNREGLLREDIAALHISSSQKHMWPVPLLSIMQTWSTMNKLICSCDVQVRRTLSYSDYVTVDIKYIFIWFSMQLFYPIHNTLFCFSHFDIFVLFWRIIHDKMAAIIMMKHGSHDVKTSWWWCSSMSDLERRKQIE